ncbi:MAG: NADH-quinone oxidoreductase subunit L, partial [Acidimicrobiia bacterium]
KAFIVNRIGDLGFLIGILLIYVHFGTLDFDRVFPSVSTAGLAGASAQAIPLLLFVGAIGKSAQFPLHVWLPDAMEGPTPVSALIHAATMVTAGVYMVARAHVLFEAVPEVGGIVAIIGVFTAIFAATIAMGQDDIKRVLAYSTVSQLGYMFLAMGIGVLTHSPLAYAAGIFHLVTHAFFKALLFLGAGSVMHATNDEVDMKKMGGLRYHLPITFLTFVAGWLAIAGIPPLAGFFSKDAILASTWEAGRSGLYLVGLLTAGLTAFYMSRQVFLTFFGTSRSPDVHPHESPPVMTLPLLGLAGLAAVGGVLGLTLPSRKGGFIANWLAPVFGEHQGAGLRLETHA